MNRPRLQIDNYIDDDYFDTAFRKDVSEGLTAEFKELPPKWFYDDRGSELFEQITRLEEYYPTEAERSILKSRAVDIATTSNADTFVELGSGVADKTRVLLDAFATGRQIEKFVPFDVSESALTQSSEELLVEYPELTIHGVVGDFEQHLGKIPAGGTKLTALLGGTVGNFNPSERKTLLTDIVRGMQAGDTFLLGTDLVKDHDRLVLAYDDPHGVTSEFNKNVLAVMNRQLGANFDLDQFEHVARFDTEHEWMDLRLRSLKAQTITIADLDLVVEFGEGEEMRTEISAKFRKQRVAEELATIGLEVIEWWTDDNDDYALSLSVLR